MKITRIFLNAVILILGLFIIQRVYDSTLSSSGNSDADVVGEAVGQFVLPVILVVAGGITYWARRRGASQGVAFAIPLLIQLCVACTLIEQGFVRRFLVMTVTPMIVVCGLIAMLVKPRSRQISVESKKITAQRLRYCRSFAPKCSDHAASG